jgi:hypothetical protein
MSRTSTPVSAGRNTPLGSSATAPGVAAAGVAATGGGGGSRRGVSGGGNSRSESLAIAQLEEAILIERLTRGDLERALLEKEERAAAERVAEDEAHRRRLMEMLVVAGQLHEDRRTEFQREKHAVQHSCTPAVVEQLEKVAHHTEVERSVVDALRRQLEARLSAQRVEATKEREKVQFYRTMLIRRMRQMEEHVRMVCGADHWLLRLPDLADKERPFTSVSGFAVQASPAAKVFDREHHYPHQQHLDAAAAAAAATPPPLAADASVVRPL